MVSTGDESQNQFFIASANSMARISEPVPHWRRYHRIRRHHRPEVWPCRRWTVFGLSRDISRQCNLDREARAAKKERAGVNPGRRGRDAAALDAAGAAMGSIGMFAFALLVWRLLPQHQTWAVLSAGIVVWLLISVTIWRIFETL